MLHVVVDDLRSSINALSDPHAITPTFNCLAKQGTVFTHAYVQQAVCSGQPRVGADGPAADADDFGSPVQRGVPHDDHS